MKKQTKDQHKNDKANSVRDTQPEAQKKYGKNIPQNIYNDGL